MSSIDLAAQLRTQARDIRRLGRGIARAQLEALDRTALDVGAAEVREIDDSFDRPTPFTRNAVFVRRTQNRVPEARVGLKDDAGSQRAAKRWLEPGIEGGSRRFKAIETLVSRLASRDGYTPIGAGGAFYLVPGPYAKLDAYGNVSRGQLVQIMSQLRLFQGAESVGRNAPRDSDYERNRSGRTPAQVRAAAQRRAGGQFFVVPPGARGALRPGIYQRQVASRRVTGASSPRPRPVFFFVDRVAYEPRFDFWGAGQRAIESGWPRHFDAALDQYARVAT